MPAANQKNTFQTLGQRIMELAERLRPYLMEQLTGCRDENGMPLQPARVRAVALSVAQEMVKARQSGAN